MASQHGSSAWSERAPSAIPDTSLVNSVEPAVLDGFFRACEGIETHETCFEGYETRMPWKKLSAFSKTG